MKLIRRSRQLLPHYLPGSVPSPSARQWPQGPAMHLVGFRCGGPTADPRSSPSTGPSTPGTLRATLWARSPSRPAARRPPRGSPPSPAPSTAPSTVMQILPSAHVRGPRRNIGVLRAQQPQPRPGRGLPPNSQPIRHMGAFPPLSGPDRAPGSIWARYAIEEFILGPPRPEPQDRRPPPTSASSIPPEKTSLRRPPSPPTPPLSPAPRRTLLLASPRETSAPPR